MDARIAAIAGSVFLGVMAGGFLISFADAGLASAVVAPFRDSDDGHEDDDEYFAAAGTDGATTAYGDDEDDDEDSEDRHDGGDDEDDEDAEDKDDEDGQGDDR